jgi:predicted double-glycine peptidase
MNYMLIPTCGFALVLFAAGVWAGRATKGFTLGLLWCFGLVFAIPGVAFGVYYLKLLGEPIWLYQFRSLPFTELSASGAGLIAGLLHGKFSTSERFRRIAGSWFFPGVLGLGLLLPYLKSIVRPPDWKHFQDRWAEGVCLQTSESSCGPACAATLLRRAGKSASEEQIARASFTSRNGTENWYLARTLRRYGMQVQFAFASDVKNMWPVPSIAGVRLPAYGNTGHFITILDRNGDSYVIGDPLEGRIVRSQAELRDKYEFTGFFMLVSTGATPAPRVAGNFPEMQ